MMQGNSEIFLFQNIRQVILAERWCSEQNFEVHVLPVPRPYSTECGMCLEICRESGDSLAQFAADHNMVIQRIQL